MDIFDGAVAECRLLVRSSVRAGLPTQVVNDKGGYRQLSFRDMGSGSPQTLRRFDFVEIPTPSAKEVRIEAFLTLTSVASKELSCMLNRLVMRPGVEWEQARSLVVWLAV